MTKDSSLREKLIASLRADWRAPNWLRFEEDLDKLDDLDLLEQFVNIIVQEKLDKLKIEGRFEIGN